MSLVGAIEALSNPSVPVKRLLALAKAWPHDLPDGLPPATSYRTMRHLREEEVDELVTAYSAGASVYTLAEQFGIHRGTVGRYLRGRGVNTTAPALSTQQIEEAAVLYRTGWSLMKIAKKYRVNDGTVWRKLRAVGVMMRSPNERTGLQGQIDKTNDKLIKDRCPRAVS